MQCLNEVEFVFIYFNIVVFGDIPDAPIGASIKLNVQSGNDKDSGLNWKLKSNSLVFMPRPRVTSWLMETTLIPNYHYILLKDDFSDLGVKLAWCNANQDKCQQIILNAQRFMRQFADQAVEKAIETEVLNKYFEILENT